MEKTLKFRLVIFVIILAVLLGVSYYFLFTGRKPDTSQVPASPSSQTEKQKKISPVSWEAQGVAIDGSWADADVVELGYGNYRMYFAVEPEVPGNKLEVYSATSTDGIDWQREEEVRREFSVFPDVIKLPDGRWRMYFQNQSVIKSAISPDGLGWTDEAGVRIDKTESGFNIENNGAPSSIRLDDSTYLMVYRGIVPQKYSPEVPNKDTGLFFYATSSDGLTWQKRGIALDSRNSKLAGWVDGAEFVKWDRDALRLYFWSYKGVYHIVYKNGVFSKKPVFDFTNSSDSNRPFPENPPGDPTLAKINGKWFLYYGQHTKGIFYATLTSKKE